MGRFLDSFNSNIAIDMGSNYTRICHNERGVVLKELSIVALDKRSSPPKVVEVGNAAHKMTGRSKGDIKTVSPLRHGVIAELDWATELLKSLMNKVLDHRLIKFAPAVVLTIPSNATGVEKKAALDALHLAGAGKVNLIEEAIAAAVGAGVDINNSTANLIVDIGGGSTDIAVINYGDVVIDNNIRVAGNDFDKAIQNYIRKSRQVFIGERTAENLKIKYGNAYKIEEDEEIEVVGLDVVSKVPVKTTIFKSGIKEALMPPLRYIAREIKQTIESSPTELVTDILENGIIITGGSALLDGITDLFQEELRIPVRLAPDPMLSVVIGADKIQNDGYYRRLLAS